MADGSEKPVGQIPVEITGNEKPLQRTIEKLGSTLQKPLAKLGMAMAAAFSAAAVIKFGKESTEAAAQVNAANSQMTQTFGELEDKARSSIRNIAKDSGILETRLQGVGTSIYAFAKTSGMESSAALSMMQEALQVTADSAAYYDRSLEDTAESLKSFLKGNFANDAALGISCTETTRNAAANKLYGKSFKDLSEAQKQLTLLQMVKDANKLSGAMGQAAREADGWENVTGNLKESWRQLQAVIGQPILKAATAVVKKLTGALQTLTVYAKSATQAMAQLFGWDMEDASAGISTISDSADISTKSIEETTEAANKLKKAVAGFDQLNILSSSDDKTSSEQTADIDIAQPTMSAAVKATDELEGKIDGLKNKLKNLFEKSGLNTFADRFKSQFDKIDFKGISKNFQSIFSGLQPAAKSALDGTQKLVLSKLSLFGTLFGGFTRTVCNNIQTISGGVTRWLDQDNSRISDFITEITGKLSKGIDNCTLLIGTLSDTYNESVERMRPETETAIAGLLSGFTTFAGSVGEIISGAFEKATGSAADWANKNKKIIGKALDGLQDNINQITSGIGGVFDDLGKILSGWWKDSGAEKTFGDLCGIIGDAGTAVLNLYNGSVKPAIDNIVKKIGVMWQRFSPVIGNILKLVRAVGDLIVAVWNGYIKPVLDTVIDKISPAIIGIVDVIVGAVQGLWDAVSGVLSGILEILTGVIDFVTGVFSGNWEKAWDGIRGIFTGIWDAIYGAVAGICEAIANVLQGLAGIITGILQTVVSVIGQVLSEIWTKISSVFDQIGKYLKAAWDGIVSVYSGVGKWFGDRFTDAWNGIKNAWKAAGSFFSGIWDSIKGAFSGAKDWIAGQFSSAWDGVVNLFRSGGEIFTGIMDSFGGLFKEVVNDLISGINWIIEQPFDGLNGVLRSIKGIDIAGVKPFDWISEIPVPSIPKLAKGGLVKAPTLAMVGDNKGAAHDPEVISPLSKLEAMMSSGNPEISRQLSRIIALLENSESVYQNNFYLDSEKIESKLVRVRKRKQRRYGGAL